MESYRPRTLFRPAAVMVLVHWGCLAAPDPISPSLDPAHYLSAFVPEDPLLFGVHRPVVVRAVSEDRPWGPTNTRPGEVSMN